MAEPRADADLDALAPAPKRVKLGGKFYRVPGDMPMPLFMRIQAYEQRAEKGDDEVAMLSELADELLALFRVYAPTMKVLPEIGVLTLMGSLGAIYGGAEGNAPPNRATRRQKKKTPSPPAQARTAPKRPRRPTSP